jgi:hypothetical protein
MHSSIFVSDGAASDREVLHRVIPRQPWALILTVVILVEVVCTSSWETFWRERYFVPDDYEDTPAMWQLQRERATGNATVLIGSSRMWQDIDLTAWQQVTGTRPIQLAVAGQNPRPMLRELANDPAFHGLVLCEITPYLFFVQSEAAMEDFMRRGRNQTLSQRASNRLNMLLERRLAFIDNETRISTLWKRAPLPLRTGAFPVREVPKGHLMRADRDTRMWSRLEVDPEYRALYKRLWLFYAGVGPPARGALTPRAPTTGAPAADAATLGSPVSVSPTRGAATPESPTRGLAHAAYPGVVGIVDDVARQVAANVASIRSRGGDVIFIRFPVTGPIYESENRGFPRQLAWEPFLAKTHTAGIHFEDYPQLQGYNLPEWSHMAAEDAGPFTRALAPLALRARHRGSPAPAH